MEKIANELVRKIFVVLGVFLIMVVILIFHFASRKFIYSSTIKEFDGVIEINEVSKKEKVNLYVVEKDTFTFGNPMFSNLRVYIIRLSNGVSIRVSEQEFNEYKENELYDFYIIKETINKEYLSTLESE